MSDAYLQIMVEEECSKQLTNNSHEGLFKFERLSFGIKVAPSIFQQIMNTMFTGLDCVRAYLGDILIKSESRHQDIKIVFERIKEAGFRISEAKFMTRIKYLGQVIDEKGRRPDPARSSTIKDLPAPTNLTKLQEFLAFANYYPVYISNMLVNSIFKCLVNERH